MIPNIGPLEIAIVLIIALIVFGPKKLPELGKSLGRGLSEFKDGLSNVGKDDHDEDEDEPDSEPAELTPPPADQASPLPGEEPEVTEVTGEVVREKSD
ncbi:MAG: twin-arginine translocase TatA/TatE family subunit [Solirubrobacterales bacterium]|nr:twin-arginine translocase TatA/TatE family subunit [Solirubrobacterales bacterium]HMT04344.1 twin-arginine translocase TatA/TatE family subunit [Solirubrobacterales bacterium]